MTDSTNHPFIAYLEQLARQENRGALAALRRGLGKPPGTATEMYRYVEVFNPPAKTSWIYYLIASLFAYHPQTGRFGNLGAQMRASDPHLEHTDALERRFTALLAAHIEDLPDYLRQAISYLKSKDVPVNWNQLFWDLHHWEDEERTIQKHWANAFWAKNQSEENNQPQTTEERN